MGSIAAVFQTHCAPGVAVVMPQPALADTADASREVREDGDKVVRTQSGGSTST